MRTPYRRDLARKNGIVAVAACLPVAILFIGLNAIHGPTVVVGLALGALLLSSEVRAHLYSLTLPTIACRTCGRCLPTGAVFSSCEHCGFTGWRSVWDPCPNPDCGGHITRLTCETCSSTMLVRRADPEGRRR